ncbi:DnaJ domain-containing protein [Govanella unica]|uniref:DnaJ domain-containing protein n=1 Tax=Govanella unica TaxID=2975056 RepID=A0A9X3Z6K1_9PROT|nr:DnaJ domain-containing protein [Govania unica]MDA5193098.1 DnaJ domain-containing protein [Govania unica]
MPWLLLGVLLLIGGLMLLRWLAYAEPSRLVRQVQVGGSLLLIVAGVGLALSGRIGFALPLIIGAVGFMAPRRFAGMKSGPRKAPPPGKPSGLSRREAYDILGLQPGASDADIREAHRRLILKVHPDHGGSDYLAARINEAKDVLFRRVK